jgi:hypothetical protein
LPKRYLAGVVAAVIATSICTVADRPASAAGMPRLPSPGAVLQEAPAVPSVPSVPALPPAPAPVPVPLPVPAVTVPAAPGSGSPAPGQGPVVPLPHSQVVEIVDASSEHAAAAAPPRSAAGQSRGAAGGHGHARGRRSSRPETMPYHQRLRLVRALRGCLHRLPEPQSDALILRYGVGDRSRRRAQEAADALNVSLNRFRAIHRRGMRNLVSEAWRSSCENGQVAGPMLASAYTAAWTDTLADAAGATGGAPGGGREQGGVLGVQQSGGDGDRSGGDSTGDGREPRGDSLFGGLPLETKGVWFVVLLAIMLAGASWIIMSFVRASR